MTSKPKCKYGAGCYRRNPQHLKDFDHPEEKIESDEEPQEEPTSLDGGELIEVDSSTDTPDVEPKKRGLKRKSTDESTAPALKRTNSRTKKQNTLDAFFGMKKTPKSHSDEENYERETSSSSKLDTNTDVSKEPTSKHSDSYVIEESCCPRKILGSKTVKGKISELYDMDMPDDFYIFWDFCKSVDLGNPLNALGNAGLHLVGPFDIFMGKHDTVESDANFHLHHRYYYDPPEFMSIVAGNEKQFHLGYFRDDPKEMPVFVASNSADENCLITPRGENIFAAVKWYLEDKHRKSKENGVAKLLDKLCDFAKKKNICLDLLTPSMKKREKKVVCKTFHGAGLVVPVDKNDVGYRPVPETPVELKKMLRKIVEATSEDERNTFLEPLEEIITFIQFANDECDYGEGVELGLDLFSFGSVVLHTFVSSLLCLGYHLLKRDIYSKTVKDFLHVRNRKLPYIIRELK